MYKSTITKAVAEGFSKITSGEVKSYWDFVHQRAKPIDLVRSDSIAEIKSLIKKVRAKQHECYRTAMRLCLENPEIKYVEGFIEVHGVPLSHAWNSYQGKHFDLTEEYLSKQDDRPIEMKHVVVAEIDQKKLTLFAMKTGLTGPYLELFWSEL